MSTTMQTPKPLTTAQLYELCEFVKNSPPGSIVKVTREELWALVDMAKESIEASNQAGMLRAELGRAKRTYYDQQEEIGDLRKEVESLRPKTQ